MPDVARRAWAGEGLTPATWDLLLEVRHLFHRLEEAVRLAHAADGLSGGERGVLRELAAAGPRTVPAMARIRGVSRQHVQSLVDGLLEERLVGTRPNPAHRRSRLVTLTADGRERLRRADARERQLLRGLDPGISDDELERAASVVRRLREDLFEGPSFSARLARLEEGGDP